MKFDMHNSRNLLIYSLLITRLHPFQPTGIPPGSSVSQESTSSVTFCLWEHLFPVAIDCVFSGGQAILQFWSIAFCSASFLQPNT